VNRGLRTAFAAVALLAVISFLVVVAGTAPVRATGPETGSSDELPPLSPRQLETVRAVARAGDQDPHVFAKVGDSMTASRAFVRCLGRDGVDLGGRDGLRSTIEHFRGGNAGGTDPFRRASRAAEVGWSTNDLLRGHPSPLRRELSTLRPRFATLMIGTNEVPSRAPRRYARRLWTILDQLEVAGVVPLVSTLPPRVDRLAEDDWARRYNLIVRGLTEGRNLPLFDLYRALEPLPGRGMARDGIHTNVYAERGRAKPCDFRPAGLQYGHNLRNLRTLQHLDRLRRAVAGDPGGAESIPVRHPAPAVLEREVVARLPFTAVRAWSGAGRVGTYEIVLSRRTELRVFAVARAGSPLTLRLVGEGTDATSRTQLEREVPAGRYRVVVEGAERAPTELLVTMDAALPASLASNPFRR
jgi:hypothetical protein